MDKKILIVVTSVGKYPNMDRATGLWLGEAVHFAAEIKDAGYEIDYVSPEGGYTPIDPQSLQAAEAIDWQWYQDKTFMNKLGNTKKPEDIDPEDYIAIYYAGGHGTVWDFAKNSALQKISEKIYAAGGYITSVCHGAVGLLNIHDENGDYLLKNKRATGFSNAEEKAVELDKLVPFLTEDKMRERGANYEKADELWAPHVVTDGRLITGQNPASGAAVAEALLKKIGKA